MRIVNGLVFCEDGAFHPLEVETQGDRIAALEPSTAGEGRPWTRMEAMWCPGLWISTSMGPWGRILATEIPQALPPWGNSCSAKALPASWAPPWPCRKNGCPGCFPLPGPTWSSLAKGARPCGAFIWKGLFQPGKAGGAKSRICHPAGPGHV